jgi:hypothetical protein
MSSGLLAVGRFAHDPEAGKTRIFVADVALELSQELSVGLGYCDQSGLEWAMAPGAVARNRDAMLLLRNHEFAKRHSTSLRQTARGATTVEIEGSGLVAGANYVLLQTRWNCN